MLIDYQHIAINVANVAGRSLDKVRECFLAVHSFTPLIKITVNASAHYSARRKSAITRENVNSRAADKRQKTSLNTCVGICPVTKCAVDNTVSLSKPEPLPHFAP